MERIADLERRVGELECALSIVAEAAAKLAADIRKAGQ
jgi:hypothetical protein